jgi:hypothetical protein
MSVTAEKLVEEARLLRQSGHCDRSKQLLAVAKTAYPSDATIELEERKVASAANPSFRRCRWALSWLVDFLGIPLFFVLMGFVAWLLGPILFVPSW